MIWTYVKIAENQSILGYHPPWYLAFRSSGASLSIFECNTYIKYGPIMQEVWVLSPDFCLKEKPPKCPRRGGTLFFAGMRAVIMGGTTPTHPTCEAVSNGVKKIKFLLGPWRSSVGSSYWLKAYHFLCNKHQEVSIFNFCKGSMWEIRVPAPWKKLHIFSTSHQRFFLREAEELEPYHPAKKKSDQQKAAGDAISKGSLSNQHFSGAS